MRPARTILATGLTLLGCNLSSEPFTRYTLDASFEVALAPWQPDGADLDNPPVVWSIARSNEQALDGSWAVRYALDNRNDQGKIWIEAPIEGLESNQTYDVEISFVLGTSDFGGVNTWRVIAGAGPRDPETAQDLVFQDDTGNGSPSDVGLRWVEKSYRMEARANEFGTLFVALGIWGTWEFARVYYLDRLHIIVTRS